MVMVQFFTLRGIEGKLEMGKGVRVSISGRIEDYGIRSKRTKFEVSLSQ